MFSIKRINEKLEKGKRKKKTKQKQSEDDCFIPLSKTFSSNTNLEEEEIDEEKQSTAFQSNKNIKDKRDLSWRFYNKLETEEKETDRRKKIMNPIEEQHPLKVKKSCAKSLKLDSSLKVNEKRKFDKKKLNPKKTSKNFKERKVEFSGKAKKQKSISKSSKAHPPKNSDNDIVTEQVLEFYEALVNDDNPASSSNIDVTMSNTDKAEPLFNQYDEELLQEEYRNRPYLTLTSSDYKSIFLLLLPGSKLYIKGNYTLKLIFGSISVLGYVFQEGEEHAVFSPSHCNFLSVDTIKGNMVKSFCKDKMSEIGMPRNWAQEFEIKEDQVLAVVRIAKYQTNMCRLLSNASSLGEVNEGRSFNMDLFKKVAGINLVEDMDSFGSRVVIQPNHWKQFVLDIQPQLERDQRTSIVLTGGKGVGKSTFLKFLINTMLANSRFSEVACLDLDPGQPEFSLSSCLSLTVIKNPILGPPSSHWERTDSGFKRSVLLGDIAVQNVVREYLHIVMSLMEDFKAFNSNIPLVVNTMGFTVRTGFDIMVDVLRIIQPSTVVTIEGVAPNSNFPFPLQPKLVSNIQRGILNFSYSNLDYNLITFPSPVKRQSRIPSKDLREANILAYLSKLWNENEINLIGENCKPAIKITWTSVAIHIQSAFVPHHCVLQSINASLVALCTVDGEFLERVDDTLPLRIQDYRGWFNFNSCLGWGIVSGIDTLTREIHILTPLDQETVMREVNVIAMPKLHLPSSFHKRFCTEDAPYTEKYVHRNRR